MRPGTAHRHNTAFARSSSLGEGSCKACNPSGYSAPRQRAKLVIVKDGTIYEQELGFRKYDDITFDAD